ncbi:MAG TPA: SDR family oxidoreductase [Acidimicrobiia bacterium]|nr:SDR family oxidoreductase [Acidimicrobiia bacterium]
MTDLPKLAITGSTGAVGGRVAQRVADAGVPQRLVVRDASDAPDLDGAYPVEASDYGDSDAMRSALEGVETLFLVSFREAEDRLQRHFRAVDAAVDAGVERIVYLSFLQASPDSTFKLGRQHYATEEHIRASGLRFTFLRSSLYADFVPFFTGDDGVIRAPAGSGKVSWVTRDDIADTVVAAVQTDAYDGEALENTGPTALDLSETAAILSRVSGRETSYVPESEEEAWESRRPTGAPDWEIEGWVSSYLAIANGELATVSDTVERLTGHPPMDLESFLSAHPELWSHLAL